MSLIDLVDRWRNKEILIIGEAIVDKYIIGNAKGVSPDAPVLDLKIEEIKQYLGGLGLTLQFIKTLGGIPKVCTIIGNDYEGNYYLKKLEELNIDTSLIIKDDLINTPQITRIKAMNQHLLRLENDYHIEISEDCRKKFLNSLSCLSDNINAIVILNYGIGSLFSDRFIRAILIELKKNYNNIPIIARPDTSNYYIYENIDLIKINLFKALSAFSIDCYTETSINIIGKKILNSTKCNFLFLSYLESESYLFNKKSEKVKKYPPFLKTPARSFVAVGSVIMAILGLCFAANINIEDAAKLALHAATFESLLTPVEFFNTKKLKEYLSKKGL
ncbi:MAG: bifunctional heptose 7-phosphate kinase/heptose 1-phosphate adenyltransferase [Promethearchaeota archaeon]